jgi:hypothetical protein
MLCTPCDAASARAVRSIAGERSTAVTVPARRAARRASGIASRPAPQPYSRIDVGREVGRQPQLNRPPHEIDERLAAGEELAPGVVGEIGAQESGIGENREVRFIGAGHAGSIVSVCHRPCA